MSEAGQGVEKYEVVAISRSEQTALLSDYQTELHWDTMLDADGEETLDAQEARMVILQWPDGTWGELDLDDWVRVTIH